MTTDEFKAALAIIKQRGLSNKDIARLLAISTDRATKTLYDWRRGRYTPNPQIALMLRGYAYHGWDTSWILEESK